MALVWTEDQINGVGSYNDLLDDEPPEDDGECTGCGRSDCTGCELDGVKEEDGDEFRISEERE